MTHVRWILVCVVSVVACALVLKTLSVAKDVASGLCGSLGGAMAAQAVSRAQVSRVTTLASVVASTLLTFVALRRILPLGTAPFTYALIGGSVAGAVSALLTEGAQLFGSRRQ